MPISSHSVPGTVTLDVSFVLSDDVSFYTTFLKPGSVFHNKLSRKERLLVSTNIPELDSTSAINSISLTKSRSILFDLLLPTSVPSSCLSLFHSSIPLQSN